MPERLLNGYLLGTMNRLLGDVTPVVEKRKPFDELAERPLDYEQSG